MPDAATVGILRAVRNGDLALVPVLADRLEELDDPRSGAVREATLVSPGRARRRLTKLFPWWRKDQEMGCDIHVYVEYRAKKLPTDADEFQRRWDSFGARINPGRSYRIFEAIAGVRGEQRNAVVKPRGYPDDVGFACQNDLWCYISDDPDGHDNAVTPEKAAEWHTRYGCAYRDVEGRHCWVRHPDWHSHTWLTADEWGRALQLAHADHRGYPEYHAVLAAMRALEGAGYLARVVAWFDN